MPSKLVIHEANYVLCREIGNPPKKPTNMKGIVALVNWAKWYSESVKYKRHCSECVSNLKKMSDGAIHQRYLELIGKGANVNE